MRSSYGSGSARQPSQQWQRFSAVSVGHHPRHQFFIHANTGQLARAFNDYMQ
jgi:hypothetical protein